MTSDAATSASLAATSASEAAASAASAAELVRFAVLQDAVGRPGWRLAGWCAGIVLVVLAAGLMIGRGTSSLDDPPAIAKTFGSVNFGVSAPAQRLSDKASEASDSVTADIKASFVQDSNMTTYDIVIPSQFAGQEFFFLLEGTARVGKPEIHGIKFINRDSKCLTKGPSLRCQVIRGTLPAVVSPSPPPSNACEQVTSKGGGSVPTPSDSIELVLSGSGHVLQHTDFAHKIRILPAIEGQDGVTSKWHDVELGTSVKTTLLKGCRVADVSRTAELTDLDQRADQILDRSYYWGNASAGRTAVMVTRDRNGVRKGNVWIAAGGAVAALGIGFLPVAYDAGRSWGRAQRRARKTKNQS